MNCHNEKEQENKIVENGNKECHNHKGHHHSPLLMLLCCLIPVVLIIVLRYFFPELGIWTNLLYLLCPLLHIVMMIGMFSKKKGIKLYFKLK